MVYANQLAAHNVIYGENGQASIDRATQEGDVGNTYLGDIYPPQPATPPAQPDTLSKILPYLVMALLAWWVLKNQPEDSDTNLVLRPLAPPSAAAPSDPLPPPTPDAGASSQAAPAPFFVPIKTTSAEGVVSADRLGTPIAPEFNQAERTRTRAPPLLPAPDPELPVIDIGPLTK